MRMWWRVKKRLILEKLAHLKLCVHGQRIHWNSVPCFIFKSNFCKEFYQVGGEEESESLSECIKFVRSAAAAFEYELPHQGYYSLRHQIKSRPIILRKKASKPTGLSIKYFNAARNIGLKSVKMAPTPRLQIKASFELIPSRREWYFAWVIPPMTVSCNVMQWFHPR